MKYFIITGTSRGIGEALARKLVSPNHHLFCISRQKNKSVISDTGMDYIEFDLNNTKGLEKVISVIFEKIDQSKAEAIYLINNAAVISPLGPIEKGHMDQIIQNIQVNLLAPMVLTSLFIQHTEHLDIEKRILNISSMSARNLIPDMSCYSTSKAALDVFTQSVGLEQSKKDIPVKIVSVWPGMIDTSLQEEARNANKESFAAAELFNRVKESGMLATPQVTADKLIELLLGDRFEQGTVVENLYMTQSKG